MGPNDTLLTTKEFASRSGLAVAQVTKLLREKKIAGEKQSGKWMIPSSELATVGKPAPAAATPSSKPAPSAGSATVYSISEFSAKTYLTEAGVTRWLKQRRLRGAQGPDGEWQIEAASLELPGVKHLIRP